MVLAFAGDSTIRRCLGIIKFYLQELIFSNKPQKYRKKNNNVKLINEI
jgi:hypothetical protein